MAGNREDRPLYIPPAAVLAGGPGVVYLNSSGLFTGRDAPDYGDGSMGYPAGDSRAKCAPGFGATGCSPGTGVTSISL